MGGVRVNRLAISRPMATTDSMTWRRALGGAHCSCSWSLMEWITALDLERWAGTITSRTDLAGIVGDLIRASAADVTDFRFPRGDSGEVHGFDGRVSARGMPPYVPDGDSVWEFGVDRDYLKKANSDYNSRSTDPKDVKPAETTFVFVTPYRWTRSAPSREEWQKSKRDEGVWRDVRALDGISLEEWFKQGEAVAARFAREVLLSMPPVSARSCSEFWSEYSARFAPPLTEDVLLVGREEQAKQLVQQLANGPAAYLVRADSPEEVVAFAVAAIRRADPELARYLEARAIVLDTEDAARSLSVRRNLVFLPRAGAIPLAGALGQRNPTIVPLGRDDRSRQNALALSRPTSDKLEDAIKTMGVSAEWARQLARTCGRSVTILARRIPSGSAVRPEWDGHRQLIPALLVGAWDAASENDRTAIASVAGLDSYAVFEDSMLPYLRMQDPPLEREGNVWKVRAPVDAFVHLGPFIGNAEVERFAAAVEKVFSEVDPALELPQDERPYAGLSGKRLAHSRWIRDGLATTLLLMSVVHSEIGVQVPADPVAFVDSLVARIPGLTGDYRMLASLEAQLPILMEAAPRPLLLALERLLEGDGRALRPVFKDADESVFGPHSPHTGLLWSLEVLAWDPSYIAEATLVLAKLARIDPGGKLANRPLKSLREIFLPWHPNTNASVAQRFAVLDQVIRNEPDVGWKLLVELLPESHSVASPTAAPRFREAGASERETVTYGSVARAYRGVIERTFRLVDRDPDRWVTIINHIGSFSPEDRSRTIQLLEELADDLTGLNRNGKIWTVLNEVVNRHRAFSDADWAMPTIEVERLAAVTTRFEPTDLVTRIKWLFDDYLPELPIAGVNELAVIDSARQKALTDLLLTKGSDSLVELASSVKHPELVATTAGSVIDGIETVEAVVDATLTKGQPLDAFAATLSAVAHNKFGEMWRDHIVRRFATGSWTSEQVVMMLLSWRDGRDTWAFVESLGSEVETTYWLRKPVWPIQADADDLQIAIEKYGQVGRSTAAIHAVYHAAPLLPPEVLLRLLDDAVSEINASSEKLTNTFSYYVKQILDSLRNRPDVSQIDVARREYAFLPLFRYRHEKLTIHSLLAESPSLFVSVICDVFKPESGEDREPTPEGIGRARAGYQLLSEFHIIPGLNDGSIDEDKLTNWVTEVRQLARKEDRVTMADEFIGHLLAHAPTDPDEVWPHRSVSNLIELLSSDVVEQGVLIERFNVRGFTTRAPFEGGNQERVLALQAREWAKQRRAWPRVCTMLERLGTRWENEAANEDIRARQDAMRFE